VIEVAGVTAAARTRAMAIRPDVSELVRAGFGNLSTQL
jgi:hypothetical protein